MYLKKAPYSSEGFKDSALSMFIIISSPENKGIFVPVHSRDTAGRSESACHGNQQQCLKETPIAYFRAAIYFTSSTPGIHEHPVRIKQ
jgi:hypothetical protein